MFEKKKYLFRFFFHLFLGMKWVSVLKKLILLSSLNLDKFHFYGRAVSQFDRQLATIKLRKSINSFHRNSRRGIMDDEDVQHNERGESRQENERTMHRGKETFRTNQCTNLNCKPDNR